jgi:outer membrane protein assembly factor BamB
MASFAVGTHDVFIGIDSAPGTLYAVDRATGKVHWQAEIDGAVDRPALVGDVVYIAAGPGGLDAFDVTTGQALWEAPVDGYSEGVVLTDGVALVATRDAPDAPGTITAFVAQSDPRAPGQ